MGTQFWVVQAFNGISYGALLFLVGAGLSLIFGVMRIVNLSHGSYFLLGGYVALSVIGTTGSWLLSIPIATLTIAVVGLIMARTFQITSLFPKLTVIDNVLLAIEGLRPTKFVMWRFQSSYKDVYEKAHRLLEQAGFLDRKDTEVRNLSHGEQRQLEIVLGLASDPKILLLDEPAAGLSSGESTEMAHFLMKLDPKLAILLIEHDMDVVFDVADEISVLHFGEILETGTPEQIKKSQRVQEIYLGTD